jgi:hypothetical protein
MTPRLVWVWNDEESMILSIFLRASISWQGKARISTSGIRPTDYRRRFRSCRQKLTS